MFARRHSEKRSWCFLQWGDIQGMFLLEDNDRVSSCSASFTGPRLHSVLESVRRLSRKHTNTFPYLPYMEAEVHKNCLVAGVKRQSKKNGYKDGVV